MPICDVYVCVCVCVCVCALNSFFFPKMSGQLSIESELSSITARTFCLPIDLTLITAGAERRNGRVSRAAALLL